MHKSEYTFISKDTCALAAAILVFMFSFEDVKMDISSTEFKTLIGPEQEQGF